jgi:hypothetical protein
MSVLFTKIKLNNNLEQYRYVKKLAVILLKVALNTINHAPSEFHQAVLIWFQGLGLVLWCLTSLSTIFQTTWLLAKKMGVRTCAWIGKVVSFCFMSYTDILIASNVHFFKNIHNMWCVFIYLNISNTLHKKKQWNQLPVLFNYW